MMRLFDKLGTQLKDRDFVELQWNRRWNGFGDFSLYIPANLYDPEIKYIQLDGRPETGIVQKIVYQQKTEGDFVTLSGYFLEGLLNWGAMWKDKSYGLGTEMSYKMWIADCFRLPGNEELPGYRLPEFYPEKAQLWKILFAAGTSYPSAWLSYEAMAPFGDTFLNLMNANGLGFYAKPLWNTGASETDPFLGLEINTYRGANKTDQVFFGKPWQNVASIEYARDESAARGTIIVTNEINEEQQQAYEGWISIPTVQGYKAYIYTRWIAGEEGESTRLELPENMGGTYPLEIIQTSALSDSQGGTVGQMYSEAKMEALNCAVEETVSVDILQNRFLYLEDYDLGDTCSVVIDEIELSFSARIVEVYEVHANNKVDVQIVLGTPRRQKYRRIFV